MAEKGGYNRRDFLKIVGAGAGMAAAGCGKKLPEKLIPYVIQPDEVIPGVATWYAGSCNECSSGCGTLVRTREGRAVKVEGNPAHPVNTGGLCTHGQATMQALYDPDRVREPLRRDVGESFKPIAWKDAIDGLAQSIADATAAHSEVALLTRPLSGSELALVQDLAKKIPALKHYEYELNGSDAVDQAAAHVFGTGTKTAFDFSKAKTIVSFGAGFLETWLSPVEFAAGWAKGRKVKPGDAPSRLVHFEPRLSLTAANADRWFMNAPGTEGAVMLALLKEVIKRKGDVAAQIKTAAGNGEALELLANSGISYVDISSLADELVKNGPSLVVAGGASTSGDQSVSTAVLANLLNAALGNIGQTVHLQRTERPVSPSYANITTLFDQIAAGQKKVGTLIVYGVNPAYTLPRQTKFFAALAKIGSLVSISGHLDETTSNATLVLPLSHQLESWGDAEPRPGVFNLNQPAMQPLYKTQSFGDTLIALAANAKVPNAKLEEIFSFYDYIRAKWKERTGEANFESRWLDYVERGGDWSKPASTSSSYSLASLADLSGSVAAPAKPADGTFSLLVYPSVNSHNGAGANKGWLQELPNPMVSAVWGSWVEVHPDVAAELGNAVTGSVVQVYTDHGFIEAPIYVTKYIHPRMIAMPLGQGHESYGRYAAGVGANALSVLPPEPAAAGTLKMLTTGAKIRPAGLGNETLVLLQGSDSQFKRGIGRTVKYQELADKHHKEAVGLVGVRGKEKGPEDEEEENPLALGPQEERKQMYHQSDMSMLPYTWGMNIDLSSCTGCSACVVACYAENNISVVGKTVCNEGREMSWLHIERYLDGPAHRPVEGFVPMMCQHCHNAPCEPVCPVYATYHTEDGLNSMVYNRCVGTRYCLNNCSYKVRRFNWYKYAWADPLNWQLNPDVTVREVGVMEKCTFCIQRIREAQSNAKDLGRLVEDGEIQPACASSCPTKAITFGNLNDKSSRVSVLSEDPRGYKVLDAAVNTQPAVTYLARVINEPHSVG